MMVTFFGWTGSVDAISLSLGAAAIAAGICMLIACGSNSNES